MKKIIFAFIVALFAQTAAAEMVVVANPGVKIASLTQGELTRIFLGQTSNFPDGSAAAPLDISGDYRNSFYTFMLKKSPAQVEKYWARMIFTGRSQPPRVVNVKDVKSVVAETAGAISYMDSSAVDGSVKVIKVVDGK